LGFLWCIVAFSISFLSFVLFYFMLLFSLGLLWCIVDIVNFFSLFYSWQGAGSGAGGRQIKGIGRGFDDGGARGAGGRGRGSQGGKPGGSRGKPYMYSLYVFPSMCILFYLKLCSCYDAKD
jgi:hypothetical protein